MGTSVRSRLVTGFTVIAVGVIAIAPPAAVPAVAQVRAVEVRATPRIELAASVADTVRDIVSNPPNPAHFAEAGAAMERIASSAASPVSQPRASTATTTRAAAALPPPPPVTLNAASDGIVAAYQAIQYWVDYGVQLSTYVLQFVPFGYQISSQLNIFYYNLIRPIANSVVYGLIVPVVNDPLNPASYVNGLITVGQASVNAAINTGIAEFNQFFGWLIPPLPPRPLATAAAVKAPAVDVASAKSVGPVTDAPVDVVPAEPATADVSSPKTLTPVDGTPAPTPVEVTEPTVDARPATAATSTPTAGTSVPASEVADETPEVTTPTEKAPPKTRDAVTSTPAASDDDESSTAATQPAKKSTAKKPAAAGGTKTAPASTKPEGGEKPSKDAKDASDTKDAKPSKD